MKMTGAEMVVKKLEQNGVKVVFGYPGAANAPIIDRLSFSSIKHILTRNEQGAAHMASGYAAVTKRAGVCTATSGPGATNLITGIATAHMDSVPMVAITGQVTTALIGKDAFQEVDITGATLPFTKHNYLISDPLSIPKIIDDAFYIANTGRPGPVLIDIPMDLLKATHDFPDEDYQVNIRGYKPAGKANETQVKKIAQAIKDAKQPVILAGGGIKISGAEEEFRKLIDLTGIPVVATMNGIGAIPCNSEYYGGMIGSHGLKGANLILNKADVVVVMGARLGDRSVANAAGLEKKTKLIHIDIDPAEIGKNLQPAIPVVGDVKDVITQLIPQLDGYRASEDWLKETDLLKAFSKQESWNTKGYVNPKYFMRRLSEFTNSNAYITTEVGQNQIWTANNYSFKNSRSFITSAGFGTMGYGLPAAIGASVAVEGKTPVIAIMGDGSFQMDLPEMGTMKQWNIPVKMVVFDNKRLGMVFEHQFLLYNSNYQSTTLEGGNPDFGKLAEAYGFKHGEVHENEDVDAAIKEMLESEGSYLLDVSVDPYEPTGGSLNDKYLPKKEEM